MRPAFSHMKNAVLASKLAHPPGHFYSPVCDPKEIRARYRDPFLTSAADIPGIDLNEKGQIHRLRHWQEFLAGASFCVSKTPPWRYYYGDHSLYPEGDARALCCFLQELKPHQVIEIGCGHSSACVLDTIDRCKLDTHCTFIDPSPERLLALMHEGDRANVDIIGRRVQDISPELFETLSSGDILLIDSTHVLKTCSDVHFELFEIMPRLKPGVFIHFHDIFFPFEYPRAWAIDLNYSWNEAYALRAMLSYSTKFTIEFWSHFMTMRGHYDFGTGASLWLSVN